MTAKNPNSPLITHDQLDRARPAAKLIGVGLGWGNSFLTSVLCCLMIEKYAYETTTWTGFVVGVVVAFGLIIGQVFTIRRSRFWYAVFLFPDALMTSVQWCQWIFFPLAFKLLPWFAAALVAALAGGVLGIISARMPEKLTFGG